MAKTKSVSKSGKPEQKALKRIDTGKIIALKRAGWTDENIAVEMRMEPVMVTKVIRWYIRQHLVGGGL